MSQERIRELINELNYHTDLYNRGTPIWSDADWDRKYFELVRLENNYNIFYSDSPTQSIRPIKVSQLNKITHSHPMLSLNKTKDIDELNRFIGNKDYIAMAKMDGLTVSLTYQNGKLIRAETRGNGIEGEDITHNALVVNNIPKRISFTKELIIDGEIICDYKSFEQFKEQYQNPRNFAAGSIRLLDANECKKRNLSFIAWDVISGLNNETLFQNLLEIKKFGFTIVPYVIWETENRQEDIDFITTESRDLYYPIDGLVFKYNNISEYFAAGKTEHHFKGGLAFKLYDEEYETTLKDIEYTMGKTGVLTPVAIFNNITIDGTDVSRANLHNISVMESILHIPHYGQKVKIFKANLIIPQIASGELVTLSNLKAQKIKIFEVPSVCPVCGGKAIIKKENGIKTLFCTNDECSGKIINKFDYFCGKKGLEIKGLSKATLNFLIQKEWIVELQDIYALSKYRKEWIDSEGFGEKSVDKILAAIEESKKCTLEKFISAISIPLVGPAVSKEICKVVKDYNDFRSKIEMKYDFAALYGFGENKSNSILNFNYKEADALSKILFIEKLGNAGDNEALKDLTFCITGKVHLFKNRDELKKKIELFGGKVTGSVSKKTSYLIANEQEDTTKYKNAINYGVSILTEKELLEKFDIF